MICPYCEAYGIRIVRSAARCGARVVKRSARRDKCRAKFAILFDRRKQAPK